jgi:hypothetical protein
VRFFVAYPAILDGALNFLQCAQGLSSLSSITSCATSGGGTQSEKRNKGRTSDRV